MLDAQCRAVRITDHQQRRVGTDLTAYCPCTEAGRGHPVLPGHLRQRRRHRAMAGHAQGQHVIAAIEQRAGDCTHAVRRIGKTVQQQRAALDPRRPQLEAAVPVAREQPLVVGTLRPVAIAGQLLFQGDRLQQPSARFLEQILLAPEVAIQRESGVKLRCLHLAGRCLRVPRLQIGKPARLQRIYQDDGRQHAQGRDEHIDDPAEQAMHRVIFRS